MKRGQKKDDAAFEKVDKLTKGLEKARKIIGEIIADSIYLEKQIDELLCEYFSKNDKKNDFMEHILDKEFFTFKQKILLFGKITEKIEEEKKGLRKRFFKRLEKIIEIRNAVAHNKSDVSFYLNPFDEKGNMVVGFGEWFKDYGKKTHIIEYKHDNKIKFLELDSNFRYSWTLLYNHVILTVLFLKTQKKFIDVEKAFD